MVCPACGWFKAKLNVTSAWLVSLSATKLSLHCISFIFCLHFSSPLLFVWYYSSHSSHLFTFFILFVFPIFSSFIHCYITSCQNGTYPQCHLPFSFDNTFLNDLFALLRSLFPKCVYAMFPLRLPVQVLCGICHPTSPWRWWSSTTACRPWPTRS